MVEHEHAETAERNLQPEDIAEQVGAPELFTIDERADEGQRERDQADDEGRGLVAAER